MLTTSSLSIPSGSLNSSPKEYECPFTKISGSGKWNPLSCRTQASISEIRPPMEYSSSPRANPAGPEVHRADILESSGEWWMEVTVNGGPSAPFLELSWLGKRYQISQSRPRVAFESEGVRSKGFQWFQVLVPISWVTASWEKISECWGRSNSIARGGVLALKAMNPS